MARRKLEPDVNHQLLSLLMQVDHSELLSRPSLWIGTSGLAVFFKNSAERGANPALVTDMRDRVFAVKRRHEKDSAIAEANRIVAKIKANRTLPLKVWAISYYLKTKSRRKLTKRLTSIEIHELLAAEHSRGLIPYAPPTAETIRTEWLKNI